MTGSSVSPVPCCLGSLELTSINICSAPHRRRASRRGDRRAPSPFSLPLPPDLLENGNVVLEGYPKEISSVQRYYTAVLDLLGYSAVSAPTLEGGSGRGQTGCTLSVLSASLHTAALASCIHAVSSEERHVSTLPP